MRAMRLSKPIYQAFSFYRSPRRRFSSSLPPKFPSKTPKRIIFGSCSDSTEDLTYWDPIHDLNPDVVVLMGDNVYGKHVSLEDQYAKLRHHASFRRASEATCILATVDDNDLYGEHAIQQFKDFFQPNLPSQAIKENGVFQSYRWNGLRLILLDVRAIDCDMLSDNQWEWLGNELNNNELTIVVSPLQVLATTHEFDCWNCNNQERERLLNLLLPKSTILLSGDRHVAALYQYQHLYEITSSSLTHSVPEGQLDAEQDPLRQSPFCYKNNFGMLDIESPNRVLATIRSCATGEPLMEWDLSIV